MSSPLVVARARRLCCWALLLVVVIALAGAGAAASAEAAGTRGAKKVCVKKKRTANSTRAVRRCTRVPKRFVRPRGLRQQAGPNDVLPLPTDGGLGGPGFNREESAIAWAQSLMGSTAYAWYCQRFVENAFNTSGRYPSAWAAARALGLRGGVAPRGALVFFRPHASNLQYGHVGLSVGGGRMISALSRVSNNSYVSEPYWASLYAGWAPAPGVWPGRDIVPLSPPNNVAPPPPPMSVAWSAPAAEQTLTGVSRLSVNASGASGVAIQAYYATDPDNINTVAWREVGRDTNPSDGFGLDWDTRTLPNQGNAGWGTVNLVAIGLDGNGNMTSTRAYRRVNIDNGVAPPPPAPSVINFTSPSGNPTTVGGTITLSARIPGASGVQFDAYYASNPADINTVAWRGLGRGGAIGDSTWTLGLDTRTIPSQGNAGWGTVNLVAIALDAHGNLTSNRHYWRVDIAN